MTVIIHVSLHKQSLSPRDSLGCHQSHLTEGKLRLRDIV
jgi:hypothetical protein